MAILRRSDLDAFSAKFGKGTLVPLSSLGKGVRISTGIFELDLELGGGFPSGKVGMVFGKRSSGKSTLMAHCIGEAQAICRYDGLFLGDPNAPGNSPLPLMPTWQAPNGEFTTLFEDALDRYEIPTGKAAETAAKDEEGNPVPVALLKKGWVTIQHQEPLQTLIVNVENAIESDWITDQGVDPEKCFLLTMESAEKTIDTIDSLIRDGYIDLAVLDSIAQLAPQAEIDKSTSEWQQGLLARLMSKAFRIWVASIISRENTIKPTILLVNQIRQKIGLPSYMNPDVKPGGMAQDFATSWEVQLTQGAPDPKDFADKSVGGRMLWARTDFKVTKNKTSPPRGYGQYITALETRDDYTKGEIIQLSPVLDAAKGIGLLYQDKGKWIMGDYKFKTVKEIKQWSLECPSDFAVFRRELTRTIIEERSKKVRV